VDKSRVLPSSLGNSNLQNWKNHTMRNTSILALVITAVVCLANPVLAQDEVSTDTATDEAGQPDAGEFKSRFRWGITGGGGPMIGGYTGGGLGVDARFGMQVSEMLGVYAQPSVFVFIGALADDTNADVTAGAVYGLGALGDLTLGDLFFLAAGPEILMGAIGSASVNADGSTAEAASGPFFSIAARTGFVFGRKGPDRRSGFSVGLDLHAVFAGGETAIPVMIFLGYESF
jgi:hypothetical protein